MESDTKKESKITRKKLIWFFFIKCNWNKFKAHIISEQKISLSFTFSGQDQEKLKLDLEQSSKEKKLKYPRAIPFIISNEFCERFNFYGMKAILVLYLTRQLGYGDDISTIIYHTFNVLVYFFCLFGGK